MDTQLLTAAGLYDSPVLIALIGAFVTCFTVVWQGYKARQATREESAKNIAQTLEASEKVDAASKAAEEAARVGLQTNVMVNGQHTAMEKKIAELLLDMSSMTLEIKQLREEIVGLKHAAKRSIAVHGPEPVDRRSPV
ncbi:MAG: hypothetical protein ACREXR_00620 [Gammaproteobacteria bacterium]